MGGYFNAFDPTMLGPMRRQLYDPSNPLLLAPTPPAAPQVATDATADEPEVSAPDDFEQRRQNITGINQRLQGEYDRAAGMNYQVPPRSRGSRVLEGLLGMFSPYTANAIFERPREEKYQQFQAEQAASGRRVGALQHAASSAERDLQLAQQHQLQQAEIGWYNRRQPVTDARTTDLIGEDGKPHRMQFNPQSGRFDIDLGTPYERPAASENTPHTVDTGTGVYQFNPKSGRYDIYVGPPTHNPDGTPKPRMGTPAQFANVEGKKNAALRKLGQDYPYQGPTAANGTIAAQPAQYGNPQNFNNAPISPEEYNARKQAIQDDYENQITALGGDAAHYEYNPTEVEPHAGGQEPRVASPEAASIPQIKQGTVKHKDGVPFVFNGSQWVQQRRNGKRAGQGDQARARR